MNLRENLLDYLTIKNLKYGEGLLSNPYEFFNYENHVSFSHFKGNVGFKDGLVLPKIENHNGPTNNKDIEKHNIYVKEEFKPLRMHANVFYSWFLNKSGGTSAVYYPYTYKQSNGVISKDIKSFNGGKILDYEEVCPYPPAKNNDELAEMPYSSFKNSIEQFKATQNESLVNSYQNLFLRDLVTLQFDRHNKNFLIAKSAKNKIYELVALDNDATRATMEKDDDKVFNNKSVTYVKGIDNYIEPYQQVIDKLKKDKHSNLILPNKKKARETLNKIANINMDDIANEIYRELGFSVDEKLVRKSQVGKEIICNDLDRCL